MKNCESMGLYIHIPFCKSKCPYCDFYSAKKDDSQIAQYTACIVEALDKWQKKIGKTADTLYVGGGTPSVIGAENLKKIITAARVFGDFSEITVECNPSGIGDGFFEELARVGVNRISLGMQSAVDSERRALGRLAGASEVEKCVDSALSAGIENISLDVMLGVPNQSTESLDETLRFCINSGVKHISAYMLKLEEGTYFYKNSNKLNLPDDDKVSDMYLQMVDTLEKAGFLQYEISNFAKQGYESRHNLKYWTGEDYLGLGPAAHSFIDGKRFYFPRNMEYFMNNGEPEADGLGGDLEEYIMLRLRLKEGINYADLSKKYPEANIKEIKQKAKLLSEYAYVSENEQGFFLTPKGFLISNTIIEEFAEIA